jgi:hypothetical protein
MLPFQLNWPIGEDGLSTFLLLHFEAHNFYGRRVRHVERVLSYTSQHTLPHSAYIACYKRVVFRCRNALQTVVISAVCYCISLCVCSYIETSAHCKIKKEKIKVSASTSLRLARRLEIYLHSFLNSALDGNGFSFMASADLTPGLTQIISGLFGLEDAYWRVQTQPKPSDFSGRKNPQHAFLRRGSKAGGPMS